MIGLNDTFLTKGIVFPMFSIISTIRFTLSIVMTVFRATSTPFSAKWLMLATTLRYCPRCLFCISSRISNETERLTLCLRINSTMSTLIIDPLVTIDKGNFLPLRSERSIACSRAGLSNPTTIEVRHLRGPR